MIERVDLGFDTAITAVSMARLKLGEANGDRRGALAGALEDARDAGVRHLVVTVGAEQRAWVEALGAAGFGFVDVAVDFTRARGAALGGKDPAVRIARPEDVDAIVEGCAGLFTHSRYYHDAFFTRAQAHEVHVRWIRNLFAGRAAEVYVADLEGRPVGFCGLLHDPGADTGRIDLIGVTTSAAGRGLGKRLVDASLAWFDVRCERTFVKTQATNLRACALYTRRGFTLHRADLTYRLTLDPR